MKRRVVITGSGVINSLGKETGEFINNIKNSKCGINTIKSFDTTDFKTKVASEVPDFNPAEYGIKGFKKKDRFIQLAIAASREVVENSGFKVTEENCERVGVILGSGIGGLKTIEEEYSKLVNKGPKRISSHFIPKVITNMAAGHVSIELGTKGVCQCCVTACASSTDAIGNAFRLIKDGYQDAMFAGGSEASVTPLGIGGFESMTALSFSEDPQRASIPFDKDRDGFVMGEGSGIVLLEELEAAKKRGANIICEVVGYGQTSDAYHITSPEVSGAGPARAMLDAIKEADVTLEDISYINAHGTSTPYNDKTETTAIKKAFGEDLAKKIPVSSTKSMTGHLLGAAGVTEALICAYALKDGFIPQTINYQNPDEECDLDYVTEGLRNENIKYALSSSLGFGGHNATVLLKKWEEQ